ncbi:MAG: ribonuclease III [Vulcanimicrobiaceae bacterium]
MSGEARRRRVRALVRCAGIRDELVEPLERAFVHESFAAEHGETSNERLEFLGDSVLGFITASWLYRSYPGEDEGMLTARKARIVNDPQLARTARRLKFDEVVQLGIGMRRAGGAENESILADALEAFVAALYLEYGLEAARYFVENEHIATLDHSTDALFDAKTRLQHRAQQNAGATPLYRDENLGTPQMPKFRSSVWLEDRLVGIGDGSSKKTAQQAAAAAALAALEESGGSAT